MVALLATPNAAGAQWLLSPSIGFNFGSDFADCRTLSDCETRRVDYGIGLGYLGTLFGFEQEITHSPSFFGESAASDKNSVTTIMSTVLVIVPLGPIRPYGTAGLGAIRTSADFNIADTVRFRDSGLGWVLGAGVMLFPTRHLGVRADVRRYRGTSDLEIGGFSFEGSPLTFSRGSASVVIRF
jgi:opacity protein-like surface antigen